VDGQNFTINYAGGNGRSVVITATTAAANNPLAAVNDLFDIGLSLSATTTSNSSVLSNDTGSNLTAVLVTPAGLGTASVAPMVRSPTPRRRLLGRGLLHLQGQRRHREQQRGHRHLMTHNALQIRKLYKQVLLREPETGGWKFWSDRLNSGTATFGTLAGGIFESAERLDPSSSAITATTSSASSTAAAGISGGKRGNATAARTMSFPASLVPRVLSEHRRHQHGLGHRRLRPLAEPRA